MTKIAEAQKFAPFAINVKNSEIINCHKSADPLLAIRVGF